MRQPRPSPAQLDRAFDPGSAYHHVEDVVVLLSDLTEWSVSDALAPRGAITAAFGRPATGYYDRAWAIVQAHVGYLEAIEGDGVLATFPEGLEVGDLGAAGMATLCARELVAMAREVLAPLAATLGSYAPEPFGSRVAITRGRIDVYYVRGRRVIVGEPIDLAARLQEHAGRDGILIEQAAAAGVAPGLLEGAERELLSSSLLRGQYRPREVWRVRA